MKEIYKHLFCLEIPTDAKDMYISEVLNDYKVVYKSFGGEPCVFNVGFKFEILGTVSEEFIDFDVSNYIQESIDLPEYRYGGELHPKETFWDYESRLYWLDNTDDSFRSLLRSKGVELQSNSNLLIIEKL